MNGAVGIAPRSDPGDHPAAGSIRVDVSGRGRSPSAHTVAAGLDGDRRRALGGLGVDGRRLFARRGRGGTVRPPGHDAPSDRTAGAPRRQRRARRSRNPMYLSLTVVYVGLGACARGAWPLVLVASRGRSINGRSFRSRRRGCAKLSARTTSMIAEGPALDLLAVRGSVRRPALDRSDRGDRRHS